MRSFRIWPSNWVPPSSSNRPPRLRARLLDPSGGIRWHLRALRYRAHHWGPFIATVARWLAAWQPPTDKLLLVGPSAGWTLPPGFIARFAQVTVLEPDPLARWRFIHHFRPAGLRVADLDLFAPGGLDALTDYADHAILFANLLGQLAPAEQPAAWCAHLHQALAPFHWSSYHDLCTTRRPPTQRHPCRFGGDDALETVLAAFWRGGSLEIIDHGTLGLAGGDAFEAVPWTLTPHQHHLVAWCHHSPERSRNFRAPAKIQP